MKWEGHWLHLQTVSRKSWSSSPSQHSPFKKCLLKVDLRPYWSPDSILTEIAKPNNRQIRKFTRRLIHSVAPLSLNIMPIFVAKRQRVNESSSEFSYPSMFGFATREYLAYHTESIIQTNLRGNRSLSSPDVRIFYCQLLRVASNHGSAMSVVIIHCGRFATKNSGWHALQRKTLLIMKGRHQGMAIFGKTMFDLLASKPVKSAFGTTVMRYSN